MKINFEEGALTLTPENKEDFDAIVGAIGQFQGEADSRGYTEARGAYGYHITLAEDGVSARFEIANAWWNYDD